LAFSNILSCSADWLPICHQLPSISRKMKFKKKRWMNEEDHTYLFYGSN
jgi:hypothetical protein